MKQTAQSARRPGLDVDPLTAAIAAAMGSACMSTAALAQGDGVGAALEEVIVTASRRETTVQELPFNIAAFSGDRLERQRLRELAGFSRWVPGLNVVDQGGRAADLMTVRGLNVTSLNASEFVGNSSGETVQTYIGDIPLYLDLRMHDIERVEVLIGPQGTLYGAGTLGGAVRYIPRAPDPERFSLQAHGDVYGLAHSDGAGYEADVAVNVPLVRDRLAFRGSVAWLDDPGFIDYPYLVREPGVSNPEPDLSDPADVEANLRRENDANWEETLSARAALRWDVSPRLRTTVTYYYQDQQAGGRTVNHRHAFGTGRYESGHRFLEPNDRENTLLSAEVVADLGFAELTSATGVSEYEELGQRDQTDLLLDFGFGYEQFPAFAAYTREASEEARVNQEIRLVSSDDGPLSWLGGLFYNDFELDAISEEFVPGYPEFVGASPETGDLEYRQLTRYELTEKAVFGELTYRFADRWAATLGGRFFEYDTDQGISVDLPLIGVFGDEQPNSASDDGFLGKLDIAYDVGPDTLAYLTVSEGYRIGGVNSIEECEDPLPPGQNVCALPHEVLIEPDTTTNYELGVHSRWAGGRVDFSGSLFHVDWQDIQTMSTTEHGDLPITVNGGGARSRGIELGVEGRTDGPWTFAASYAYTDAELTSDASGIVGGADAFSGDRLSGTPEHQGSVHASYSRPLANGMDLDVGYGISYTGDVLTKVGLRGGGERLGGYALHSASVSLGRDGWSASLYADNLLDEFAETAVRQDPSFVRDVNGFQLRRYFRNVLRPRTIGLEFRYRLAE